MKPTKTKPLSEILHRNIDALMEVRRRHEEQKGAQERIADRITRFAGSLPFVYLHLFLLVSWFVINLGWLPGVRPFDPYPFVMLAMIASVEAIFLSTFVLISQNRMGELAEKRAELDVQVGLLTEHELTQLIAMVDAISKKLGVDSQRVPDLEEIKKDIPPETVLDAIESANKREAPAS